MARPRFQPTPEQRKLVKSLAAVGLRQEHICEMLRLRSPKTLRKYFREELFQGFAQAYAAVARTAYDMARSGRYPAMLMFWLKCQAQPDAPAEMEEPVRQTRNCGRIVVVRPPNHPATEGKVDAAA